MARYLDPAAALAFRTPLHEHVHAADGKAAGILTLLGLMFTVLARLGNALSDLLQQEGYVRLAVVGLLAAFSAAALGSVIQAFRTIAPRFPPSPPTLAFFGDIARLTREEYVARVRSLTAAQALGEMLAYNHTNARIIVAKFRQLVLCFRFFRAAVLCWLLLTSALAYRVLHHA